MTQAQAKRLISTNAMIWAIAAVASVVLPFIGDSLTEGRGQFLRLLMHGSPLFIGLYVSTALLSKYCGKAEESA